MTKLVLPLALVLAACGDNKPPVELPTDMPLLVTLSVPEELAVGAPLHVAWEMTGAHAGAQLALQLRAPGLAPLTATSAGYFASGATPPSGSLHHVATDGLLHDAPMPFAATPTGAIDVTLPSATHGDWLVELRVLDDSGATVTTAREVVWVAEGPAVKLDVSQTWARPDALVHARVRVRGTEAEAMRLSAWLTLPDERIVSLPGVTTEYAPVVEGQITPGTFDLFSDELGLYGEGRYAISLRLETLDGTVRASAGAVIRVCDQQGTLSGRAIDPAGSPLGAGIVRALGQDGAEVIGVVESDGTFSLSVAPGLQLVLAEGDGWSASATPFEMPCGDTRTIEMTSTRAVARTAARRSPAVPQIPTPAHHDTAPRPFRVKLQQTLTVPDALRPAFASGGPLNMARHLREKAPAIQWLDEGDMARASTQYANRQLLGVDTVEARAGWEELVFNEDALLQIQVGRIGSQWLLVGSIFHSRTVENYNRGRVSIPFDEMDIEALSEAEDELADQLLVGLEAKLRRGRPQPYDPHFAIAAAKTTAAPGESILVATRLMEWSPAAAVPGVFIRVEMLDGTTVLASAGRATDAQGQLTETFTVPPGTTAESVTFRASVERVGYPDFTHTSARVTIRPSGQRMSSPEGTLVKGKTVPVSYTGSGQAGTTLSLTTTNGTADTPTLMLDPQSRGTFQFTAGSQVGRAAVRTGGAPFAGPATGAQLPFYVIDPYDLTASVEPGEQIIVDEFAAIKGTLYREGAPVPNARVSLTKRGDGTLTGSATTDSDGRYIALFRAPSTGSGSSDIVISAVIDGFAVEKVVTIEWHPGCDNCSFSVSPDATPGSYVAAKKGQQIVFSSNQPATWTASSGSMNQSVFTAPQQGGVVHVTATSITNGTVKVVPVVVDCSLGEVVGGKSGILTTLFGTPTAPVNCSVIALASQAVMIDGKEIYAGLGCPAVYQDLINWPEQGCSWVHTYRDLAHCSGDIYRYEFGPDLTTPGNTKHKLKILQQDRPAGTPAGTVPTCETTFEGEAIIQ